MKARIKSVDESKYLLRPPMAGNKVNKYITILTFSYTHEMITARALLELHEIDCNVKDELTTQVAPIYSNVIGGIKLQVQENDLQKAIKLLIEAGYLNERDLQPEQPLIDLDKIVSKFPIVKKLGFGARFLLAVTLVIGVVGSIVYYVTLPSSFEILTKNKWCLAKVKYQNKNYLPQTKGGIIFGSDVVSFFGLCEESITFDADGTVTLPGFKSPRAEGRWELENDLLHISSQDNFAFVYNGTYKIDFNNATLELSSPNTILYCNAE